MSNKLLRTCSFEIDNALSEELKFVGKQEGVNLCVILLAVYKLLLYRHGGQYNLIVATPNTTFSNILILKTGMDVNEPFNSLVQRVKDGMRQAYLNVGNNPDKTTDSRSKPGYNPLLKYMFVLQNYAEEELNRDKFDETISKFELTLSITQTSNYLHGAFIYSRDVYNEGAVTQLAGHYKQLLHEIVRESQQRIGELSMLTAEEREVLKGFNNTHAEYPTNRTIINLFEDQVVKNPAQIALVFKQTHISYSELNARSNKLANYLKQKGIGEGTPVLICLERSIEMIVGLLAIWKAGGIYVPIEPDSPVRRVKHVLTDTNSKIILSDSLNQNKVLHLLPGIDVISIDGDRAIISQFPSDNLDSHPSPKHPAYIIYTSGSTGKPKGVMVEHSSIFNYITTSKEKFINEKEHTSGTFVHLSYTFDASLKSLLTPLTAGKLTVISAMPPAYAFADTNLHAYAPYDFIQLTPAHLDSFYPLYKDRNGRPVTGKVSIGGEALYLSHFNSLIEMSADLEVVNEYGPTEATVACTSYSFNISGGNNLQRLPIGKPLPNVQIHILNEYNQPVPVGVIGEICVAGVQVARGYLNNLDLTKKKFIPDPFNSSSGTRVYKTGDMGRWLPDGNIECLGRKDNQVKIRGYRVEPGEIENILLKNEMINQVTVVPKEDEAKRKYLVAYVVPNGVFNKKEIISYLRTWLPGYMIPENWIIQSSLPLTINGKIDRRILPEPVLTESKVDSELIENFTPPRNSEEKMIAQIWQDVLGVTQVGVTDNFFELGEPSLLAIKVLRLVEEFTGKFLPLSTIYENPTLEKFTKRIQETH